MLGYGGHAFPFFFAMRTQNRFFTEDRFIALAAWRDRAGVLLLWPAFWVEPGVEVGLEVRLHRLTLGWWCWRVQLDVGRYRPRSPRRSIDWGPDGLDAFLWWAGKVFGGEWTRPQLEALLQEDPAWYRLIALGGPPSHYTRVLLAREILQRRQRAAALDKDVSLVPIGGMDEQAGSV